MAATLFLCRQEVELILRWAHLLKFLFSSFIVVILIYFSMACFNLLKLIIHGFTIYFLFQYFKKVFYNRVIILKFIY